MSSSSTAQVLMRKGKRGAAAYIHADCANGSPQHLGSLLDVLLNPSKAIDEWETIDWCRWLIAGGRTPDEFAAIVRGYDNHAKCGLVWIPHVVAYRCRTCGISPCMSICRDCFRRGDHSTHDFNMFLSQAGGACDCGDTSVMKEDGFCSNHGINNCANKSPAPADLMCVAEAMMPRVILRLLQHFRENSWGVQANSDTYRIAVQECEGYVSMLMEFNNMGELMRKAMTKALINPQMYRNLVDAPFVETEYGYYMAESRRMYEEAVKSFPSQEPPDEFRYLPALGAKLVHTTLLEEFIFWTFKYEFPQNVVCFLLNMLPDQDYKEHLTRTFVMHYARIPLVLEASADPDTLSNRVVHMSVQLFSNEALALRMVQQLHLLHVMVVSLKLMMGKILIQSTLNGKDNYHYVIDCARRVMKEHCYWPLVSDFNNVLSHRSVALVFLQDDTLIEMWFEFLSMLQGMNVNIRELGGHVEFEPSSYYAAFSCELEAAAYPMWSVIGHLTEAEHAPLAKRMVSYCISYLFDWLDEVNFTWPYMERTEAMHASFHFPLHRYLAAFLCQAVKSLGVSPSELVPPQDMLSLLMMHPLRVQSLFYEILSGIWVRNGLQIKGQAMTYIQANFCNSMVDMDIYFLQVCAAHLPKDQFVNTCIDTFGVREWLSLSPMTPAQEQEQDAMVEGLLTFLAILVSSRTNLGNDELTQSRLEVSTLLATGDKTHSQLLELMPERSGNAHTRNFETVLKELSTYRPPPKGSENLEQGLFVPKPVVWEKHYDPLHVLQRAVHRRDFQNSMERFTAYVASKHPEMNQQSRDAATAGLWAPLRRAMAPPSPHGDPRALCDAAPLHAALLAVLHRAVHRARAQPASTPTVATPPPPSLSPARTAPPDHVVALAVFLLEVAVDRAEEAAKEKSPLCQYSNSGVTPGAPLLSAFTCDNIRDNARTLIGVASLPPRRPNVSPEARRAPPAARHRNAQRTPYPDSDNDTEWEGTDSESGASGSASASLTGAGRLTAPSSESTALAVPPPTTAATRSDNWQIVRRRRRQRQANLTTVSVPNANLPNVTNPDDYVMHDDDDDIDVTFELALPGIEQVATDMVVALQGEMSLVSTTQDDVSSVSSNEDQYGMRGLPAPSESPSPSPSPAGACVPYQFAPPTSCTPSTPDALALATPTSGTVAINKMRPVEGTSSEANTIQINESIISLLLKLHSQLSGSLDSFSLDDDMEIDALPKKEKIPSQEEGVDTCASSQEAARSSKSTESEGSSIDGARNAERVESKDDGRIGGGAWWVGRLLRRLCTLDAQCAGTVAEVRRKLWPHQREKQAEQRAREQREKEERAKRAKERQQRLMQDFARRQTQFMKKAMESEECAGMDWHEEEDEVLEKEYDCVICNTTSPSTETNPIGLVVLLQSTSVVGHRRLAGQQQQNASPQGSWEAVSGEGSASGGGTGGGSLPLSDAERPPAPLIHTLAAHHSHRLDEMDQHFDAESWLLAVNIGWEGGVHVQSCGHHLHLHCLQAYLRSLTNPQRPHNLHIDRGEFLCPVCRQLANSVLPLSPALGHPTLSIASTSRTASMEQLCDNVYDMISNYQQPSSSTKLSEAMGKAMEDMTNATQLKPKGRAAGTNGQPSHQRLFSFVTSIARTNLEAELVQRGGTLVRCAPRYRPRRDCAVPLLHVLSLHARVLAADWGAFGERWRALSARPAPIAPSPGPSAPLVLAPPQTARHVPELLLDPLTQLLHFLLLAPLQLDLSYFTCLVRVLYNLTYYQIVAQIAAALTAGGRAKLAADSFEGAELSRAARLLLSALAGSELFTEDGPPEDTMEQETPIDMEALEKQIQELCLPFLRIASLLRHHLYGQDLPDVQTPQVEFGRLVYYLDLITEGMEWRSLRAGSAVWTGGSSVARSWARRFGTAAARAQLAARRLLRMQHRHWAPPRLLRLPRDYDRLFTYYHERVCGKCGAVPKESSVCLLCGTVVCLKQQCCRQLDVCEAVQHSVDCGGGTGIFLVVTSTYIIVIRGRRACLWGSLYLDDYDEEDRDLKRGKPLYLSEDRFDLLESQWLAHRFDHTKRTWVWHRDSL